MKTGIASGKGFTGALGASGHAYRHGNQGDAQVRQRRVAIRVRIAIRGRIAIRQS